MYTICIQYVYNAIHGSKQMWYLYAKETGSFIKIIYKNVIKLVAWKCSKSWEYGES